MAADRQAEDNGTDEAASVDRLEKGIAVEISPDVAARVEAMAVPFVEALSASPVGSPAFRRAISAIDRLGDRELRATTEIAARFLDRPTRALEEVLTERGPLSRDLRQLQVLAGRLQKRTLDGKRPSEDAAREIEQAEGRIRDLVGGLESERGILETDNAALAQQERALWVEIQALRQYAFLAARLDDLVEDRIGTLAAKDPRAVNGLRGEALYAIRRRRRDLLLQLAVATQGYATLRLIEQDNLDVIWAIRAAVTTTASALRTALFAARATADRGRSTEVMLSELRQSWDQMLGALREVDSRRRKTMTELERGTH